MYRMGLMALIAADIPGVDRNKLISTLFSWAVICYFEHTHTRIVFFYLLLFFIIRVQMIKCNAIVSFLKYILLILGVWKWLLFTILQKVCCFVICLFFKCYLSIFEKNGSVSTDYTLKCSQNWMSSAGKWLSRKWVERRTIKVKY